ncbi:long-chain-fatty-acid-CoA ligase ACSBG2 [Capsaspora owczarzaki ATCC 30864]|uniref:Long-chain-fatty-acid-CoA ligase ACSBG2 n=1 Tax=Capsaspora owczarzaki (strain ATCC 30864) TaxID=595528 RepID=A0A0D2WJ19_CAPO3|nr:long-chain-fatty-acid-CoA ligase ACSBG2 [Capsaspora owczarzaki ATCC 30864]KJE89188.1 long-chain-fatty-acid-CoA ligase ACSBG2 [Capsaspora owczarzaki ATCC 30864]|eukprot:XP_004365579.1 long-chain-fatty-acid-CoA ligase ACSBG2 [Capsaspora owczarzaki ATCC 30864]
MASTSSAAAPAAAGAVQPRGPMFRSTLDGVRPLVLGSTGNAALRPDTITACFQRTAERLPNHTALTVKRNNVWVETTYGDYWKQSRRAGKALLKLGVQPFDTVGILGFNSPEWLIAFHGTIMAGGVGFGIYTTNTPDACQFVLEHAKAGIVIVENNVQLRKILEVRARLPDLKHIVQYIGKPSVSEPNIYSWDDFMALGDDAALEEPLQQRIANLRPEQPCAIVYTSGTTGNPKAVMTTHDNILFTVHVVSQLLKIVESDVLLSFLPLSHIAAMMIDVMAGAVLGSTLAFAQPDALKGTLGDTLREVRPTAFLGVPRVWEKIAEKMQMVGASNGAVKKSIAGWAKKKGLAANLAIQEGKTKGKPSGWWLARSLVFAKVKKAIGLDRCRAAFSGAAPISLSTLHYFLSLDIPVYELYGMSETTALLTVSIPNKYRSGSCGYVPDGVEVRIAKPDADGNGEIVVRGRNVMLGYLHDAESSQKDFDADGFLHTGDIGKLDAEGFLRITGRIKELVITAGGENIAPTPIESLIKTQMPYISQAMIVGDKRKYLVVLLTIKCEFDEEGAPLDELTEQCKLQLADAGVKADISTVSALVKDKVFNDVVEASMAEVNKHAISNAASIKRWAFCPVDFSIPGNELGPTLKLKRRVIQVKYSDLIDTLYD